MVTRGEGASLCSRRYPRPPEKTLAAMPNGGACVGVTRVTSYDELKAEVLAAPGFWCDGTPPNAPPITARQHATLNAGQGRAGRVRLHPCTFSRLPGLTGAHYSLRARAYVPFFGLSNHRGG